MGELVWRAAPNLVRGQRVTDVKLRRAKELRRLSTSSEAALWAALRNGKLRRLHFRRRQQVIDGFIADFYRQARRLVLEVDGDIHADQQDYEAERGRALAAHNLRVLRVSNDQVLRNLPALLARIEAAGES